MTNEPWSRLRDRFTLTLHEQIFATRSPPFPTPRKAKIAADSLPNPSIADWLRFSGVTKSRRSAFTRSFRVVHMPCRAPS